MKILNYSPELVGLNEKTAFLADYIGVTSSQQATWNVPVTKSVNNEPAKLVYTHKATYFIENGTHEPASHLFKNKDYTTLTPYHGGFNIDNFLVRGGGTEPETGRKELTAIDCFWQITEDDNGNMILLNNSFLNKQFYATLDLDDYKYPWSSHDVNFRWEVNIYNHSELGILSSKTLVSFDIDDPNSMSINIDFAESQTYDYDNNIITIDPTERFAVVAISMIALPKNGSKEFKSDFYIDFKRMIGTTDFNIVSQEVQ